MWDRVWKDCKLLTGTCQRDARADIQTASISTSKSASFRTSLVSPGTNFAWRTAVTHFCYTKKTTNSCFSYVTLLHLWAACSFCPHNPWIPGTSASASASLYPQWPWLHPQHPPGSFHWLGSELFYFIFSPQLIKQDFSKPTGVY